MIMLWLLILSFRLASAIRWLMIIKTQSKHSSVCLNTHGIWRILMGRWQPMSISVYSISTLASWKSVGNIITKCWNVKLISDRQHSWFQSKNLPTSSQKKFLVLILSCSNLKLIMSACFLIAPKLCMISQKNFMRKCSWIILNIKDSRRFWPNQWLVTFTRM